MENTSHKTEKKKHVKLKQCKINDLYVIIYIDKNKNSFTFTHTSCNFILNVTILFLTLT